MSIQSNAVIEVALVRQNINGLQCLIIEDNQQLRAVIHRLALIPVIEDETGAAVQRAVAGVPGDIILLDKDESACFVLNLDADVDQGYLVLGLIPTRFIPGITIKSHDPLETEGDSDSWINPDLNQDTADRTLVANWLSGRSDWLQNSGPVLYA